MKSSSIKNKVTVAYVAFGSNMGDRKRIISSAIEKINHTRKMKILCVSSLYKTAAIGGPRQSDFINGVLKIKTSLPAKTVLSTLLNIEQDLGRKRRVKWGPRTIDLDLLTFGKTVSRKKNLQLPHPRYHQRRFVLVPFCELAPGFVHPVLKSKNRTLLNELTPHSQRVTILRRWKK